MDVGKRQGAVPRLTQTWLATLNHRMSRKKKNPTFQGWKTGFVEQLGLRNQKHTSGIEEAALFQNCSHITGSGLRFR